MRIYNRQRLDLIVRLPSSVYSGQGYEPEQMLEADDCYYYVPAVDRGWYDTHPLTVVVVQDFSQADWKELIWMCDSVAEKAVLGDFLRHGLDLG